MSIEKFLSKYIEKNEKVILACSTGPDSMYLLYKILKSPFKENIVVAYFNHKIRKESKQEENFLKDIAKKHNFIVEIGKADILKIQKESPSKSIEEIGRERRYLFFEELKKIYDARYVLTAHHLDDKIETFFFNLARGSKLTGLINMTEASGNILRPLLGKEKKEIIKRLEEKNLAYNIDSSNYDTTYTRNYLRHDIIPLFERINKSYKKNINNTLDYFENIKEFIDDEVKNFLP